MKTENSPPPESSAAERTVELIRVMECMPEQRSVDRIRKVASLLHCGENTVRIWRMSTHTRPIPGRMLQFLKDALAREGVKL